LLVGLTDFTNARLIPALRKAGLTADEIVGNRKVQETVYLLERAGLNLGFRFKWEVFGPFSSELADEIALLDRANVEMVSRDLYAEEEAAAEVGRLMPVPDGLSLRDEEWLRLLISVDFVEQRAPGSTANGGTPPFISLNFAREDIEMARQRVDERLRAAPAP
jgi:hypothetical protein